MRVGVLDLVSDAGMSDWANWLYGRYIRKQFMSIMPQAVSVWCRQLGHEVHYNTYWGQCDPLELLPGDLDFVFFAAYTQSSALAYALSTYYRKNGAITAIGGAHARSFPTDCARFFDFAVKDCDRALVEDMLEGRADRGIVSSGRPLTEFPTVEERMPEIRIASFHNGKRLVSSIVPILSSIGCPYTCSFCVDWNSTYVALPTEQLHADLAYLSKHHPKLVVGYHDPNFAVRYDATMDVISRIPEGRRNPYIMESSLSILKEGRLKRLSDTNCIYVAPGIESWIDFSNKSGSGARKGRDKLEHVVRQIEKLSEHVPGIQANFIFGCDNDGGREPVDLTKEFIQRLPQVWPALNIPAPFGGTPLYDQLYRDGRILAEMPFAFYYAPFLAITLKHYDPRTYYDHLVDLTEAAASYKLLLRRLRTKTNPKVRFIHALRALATRVDIHIYRRFRRLLDEDPHLLAFQEGRDRTLPEFYHHQLDRKLGRYAELFPRAQRRPRLEAPALPAPRVLAAE
jgi:hypothetical protein